MLVFGSPIHEEEWHHERRASGRCGRSSSDALSSVAYATEEILLVLAELVLVALG